MADWTSSQLDTSLYLLNAIETTRLRTDEWWCGLDKLGYLFEHCEAQVRAKLHAISHAN